MAPIRTLRARNLVDLHIPRLTRSQKENAPLDTPQNSFPRPNLTKRRTRATGDLRPPPLELDDLECIRTLGQGVFGKVLLTRLRHSQNRKHPFDRPGTLFAMKAMKKIEIRRVDDDHKDDKNFERESLSTLPWSPFVSGLIDVYYDRKNLYLALELIPCGSLFAAIQKRAPFDNMTSAFYFSNIVCGLLFLEQHDIVHRDLKPENILLGPDGYLSLADFGYAKNDNDPNGWDLVGTPSYMAPETIGSQHYYGRSLDWWAAGCILYEMVTRKLPFYANTSQATYAKIQIGAFKWPKDIRVDKSLRDLVTGLLTPAADQRLGSEGAIDVMSHPWLSNVDWGKMKSRQYTAPFVPREQSLTEDWLEKALPSQQNIPGIHVVDPPVHRQYDDRFPKRKYP